MTNAHKDIFKLLGLSEAGTDAGKIEAAGKEIQKAILEVKTAARNLLNATHLNPQEKGFYEVAVKEIEALRGHGGQSDPGCLRRCEHGLTMMIPIETRFQGLNKKTERAADFEHQLSKEKFPFSLEDFRQTITISAWCCSWRSDCLSG